MEIGRLLRALQDVDKRAERLEPSDVIATYVNDPTLVAALTSRDNGIIYGRRGAGKTHASRYLAEKRRLEGDMVIYIDMSTDLGSTGSLYFNDDYPLAERATRLLVDAISIVHRQLLESALAGAPGPDISTLEGVLEHLSEVIVNQAAETETSSTDESGSSSSGSLTLKISKSPEAGFTATGGTNRKQVSAGRRKASGPVRTRVHFGAIAPLFRSIFGSIPAKRVWLIIDEWNSIPPALQPYLGEMLRRLFFTIPKVTVRIAAIPQRTEWRATVTPGNYVGVEVGAEIFPILDLDEFAMFLDNIDGLEDERRAFHFYGALLLNHLNGVLADEGRSVGSVEELTQALFSGHDAVAQLAVAANGVPRDAIAIVARAAQRSLGKRITVQDIREAARKHYLTVKLPQINASPVQRRLLDDIVEHVAARGASGFFLVREIDTQSANLARLVDDRLIHVVKRGYTRDPDSQASYDLLRIDYGSFAETGPPAAPRVRELIPRFAVEHDPDSAAGARLREEVFQPDVFRVDDQVVHDDESITWRHSSSHTGNGGVLIGYGNGVVYIRDGKAPDNSLVVVGLAEWHQFLSGVKRSEFDIDYPKEKK
ncbi:DUF397 domain-containing protein [Paractinoplanes atraurantiacus]|uniref:DUF397 domain-containing protein n=1 Tax=Paractinoplanes atraurantiacus TaxID=1036182 RepID=A0A285KTA3_9ACTN|nr:DUF397 domain-containing protein [Actinoplanes atraurantiacus]SNY74491.1 protein of unknown function [Actinoplanes atraurantiacus]